MACVLRSATRAAFRPLVRPAKPISTSSRVFAEAGNDHAGVQAQAQRAAQAQPEYRPPVGAPTTPLGHTARYRQDTWYTPSGQMSDFMKAARRKYLVSNYVVAGALVGLVLTVYYIALNKVSQDDFSDLDELVPDIPEDALERDVLALANTPEPEPEEKKKEGWRSWAKRGGGLWKSKSSEYA